MKVLVFSDSHGSACNMLTAISDNKCDAIVFLGDGWRDADTVYNQTGGMAVICVCGNCDSFGCDSPQSRICELGGVKFYLTHGHNEHVKAGTGVLLNTAKRLGCEVALYGHTHVQCYEKQDGVMLINPGSIKQGRYALLEINKEITVKFGDIYG